MGNIKGISIKLELDESIFEVLVNEDKFLQVILILLIIVFLFLKKTHRF